MYNFNVFRVKKLQLMICKKIGEYAFGQSRWELMLGFDRLKTTPDRSSLAAGCTTTLSVRVLASQLFIL